ncbi:two-component system response regulator YesN [Hydrogenoanaerobacterium saccharovorans]|uniref:Stage 0 sporulation protein A homolog n=1 Tax=Hydrogenoanaerobacterium saccharovorans TaxID=474960 RepID=A0A1H8BVC1_9FIRM|nr:response regulator [Hydrogenoanaerobacterium saccharovorans]RPF47255.1 two-component system response regulator YesN [Hydrogenoanaerobacterium saccharovorans]SEM85817.1 two-component system, response regulator YesN [Hydrogenoanaerobacterium saccharovorans]
MYKLLIVEDEPIEREAVKLVISNNCENISRIEEAENGFIAIEKCKVFRPDIVILDINMPGINGLDTIKELQKQSSQMKFLLLTSYNRFEYAQEAIQLGVEDFVLKPAKIARIKQAVDAVIEKLNCELQTQKQNTILANRMEDIRPIVESDCIYALISKEPNEDLQRIFSFLDFTVNSGFCFAVSCNGNHRFVLNKIKKALHDVGIECIGEQLYNMLIFFVLENKQLETRRMSEVGNFVSMLLYEMGKVGKVGIGNIYDNPYELNLSYHQAIDALNMCDIKGARFLIYEETCNFNKTAEIDLYSMANKLMTVLQNGSQSDLEKNLENITSALIFKDNILSKAKEQIYRLIILTIQEIKDSIPSFQIEDGLSNLSMNNIMTITDGKELKYYFKMTINNLAWLVNQQKNAGTSAIIQQALTYIETSYNKDIFLDDIADSLGITPFYLSKIIKKQTGKNFTDLVAEKRISKAKELLTVSKSIKEITYEIGFNSQNYFTKIFKKYVGVTPSEYKNNLNIK